MMYKGGRFKIYLFLQKNKKMVLIVLGFLIITGSLRRFLGRIGVWWSLRNAGSKPGAIDYDMLSISINAAVGKGFWSFKWGTDETQVLGYINSLPGQDSFLQLCRKYALKYGKDLRAELRAHFNDKDYAKLLWK